MLHISKCILFLGALFFRITFASSTFESILDTNQYLLVGVTGCRAVIETNLPPNSCPLHYTDYIEPYQSSCSWSNIILLTDPSQSSTKPPKILAVGKVRNRNIVLLKSLEFPTKKANSRVLSTITITEDAVELEELSRLRPLNVLFDSVSQTLFVMTTELSDDEKVSLLAYVINDDNSEVQLQLLFSTIIPEHVGKMHWFSDPYSKQFYYYENNRYNEPIRVRSFKFTEFLRSISGSLVHGEEKEQVDGDRRAVSVSGGILSSTRYSITNLNFIGSLTNKAHKVQCQFKQRRVADTVLVVKEWDYCRIRDGEISDFKKCERERLQWKNAKQVLDSELTSILLILTVLVIAIAVVLVAVFFTMRRKWSKMSETDDEFMKSKPDICAV
ncbi:hypothetical protein QR680_000140 [Steinernema hermaphroditum]|uniref:Sema domain-containing protein n=1 Tax=Steinernema hermaphroditum TaxID=289476 RepID=A0AA39GTJ0_9BILA|nr:hypothetical protein QR680_000140 [Steinernema hermaphroditum]